MKKTTKTTRTTTEKGTTNNPTSQITRDKQRGISVFELLFAAATLGTAILFAAQSDPKIPRAQGD